jgi:hypothetical protein
LRKKNGATRHACQFARRAACLGRGSGVPLEGSVRLLPHFITITASILIGSLGSGAADAQQVPTVNIAATCRAASSVTVSLLGSTGTNDFQVCMDGENRAREQIIKDWSAFAASDRVGCVQPNVYLPSYIEWLTCMEMNKAVREARAASHTPTPNSNAPVTLPRVNWRASY